MAQGDQVVFKAWGLKKDKGQYLETDTYSYSFCSDFATGINPQLTDPKISDFTVVSGGNIAASADLTNLLVVGVGDDVIWDADDPGTFLKDALNPTDIRTLIIFNNTSTNDDCWDFFDLTTDGVTPLDLVNNDLTIQFGAGGIVVGTY